MIEVNNIYNIDCVEGMKNMNDNSVDITITSPPYNIGKSIRGNMYEYYSDDLDESLYYEWIKKVISELIRVTKYYVFFNFQMLTNNKNTYLRLMNDFKYNIKDIIIWNKNNCAPASMPTCLSSQFEFIIVFAKRDYAIKRTFERANFNNREEGKNLSNVINGNNAAVKEINFDKGENNATFPKYFVRWFIKNFAQKNDIILDPFMGSGTTSVVCKENNINYIGFEIEEKQCEIIKNNLKQEELYIWIDNERL